MVPRVATTGIGVVSPFGIGRERFWTALSRGRRGTRRCLRHRNYVGVLGELAGVLLATGAWIFGSMGVLLFAGLMVARVRVEMRMLSAILRRT